MKLLIFLAFGTFMIVQGNPISQIEGSEEDLKEAAQKILNQIQPLLNDFNEIKEKSKIVPEEMHQKEGQISRILDESVEVTKLKEELKNAASNGKNIVECQKILDDKLHSVGADLKKAYYDIIEGNLKGFVLRSNYALSDVELIKDALQNHLDREVDICKKDPSKCNITGLFVDMTNVLFATVDDLKTLPSLVDNVINILKIEAAPQEVNAKIVPAVNECLKK